MSYHNLVFIRKRSFTRMAAFSLSLLAGLLSVMISAQECRATIMQYLEVEDLARLSSDVFHCEVLSMQTNWSADHSSIYTAVEVRVIETYRGSIAPGQVVTIYQSGGTKDGLSMDFDGRPRFTVGESTVLFTTHGLHSGLIIVGMVQGKMRVEGSEVVREFSGVTLVEKSAQSSRILRSFQPPHPRISINEFRTRIAAVK